MQLEAEAVENSAVFRVIHAVGLRQTVGLVLIERLHVVRNGASLNLQCPPRFRSLLAILLCF